MDYSGNTFFIASDIFTIPLSSTHNYNTLDIVNEDIKELEILNFIDQNETTLEENITILNFWETNLLKILQGP